MPKYLASQGISLGGVVPVDQLLERRPGYPQQSSAIAQIERLKPVMRRSGPVDEPVETVDSPALLSLTAGTPLSVRVTGDGDLGVGGIAAARLVQ
jgi:hypothetical protein